MPTVDIKGVGQAQFPDGMSAESIREFLRSKYSQQAVNGQSDMLSPRADTITPYEPTLTERMGQGVSNALYDSGLVSDRYGAQRVGETISSIGEFLPGVGDATAGDEFGRAVAQGDKVGMGLGLLGAIPIAGDALKKAVKVAKDNYAVAFKPLQIEYKLATPERKVEILKEAKVLRQPLDFANSELTRAGLTGTKAKAQVKEEAKPNKTFKGKVYHQTSEEFDDFDLNKGADGTVWFTGDKKNFTDPASSASAASGKGRVLEREVELKKAAGFEELDKYSIGELKQQGYDGAVLDGDIQVFNKDAIKQSLPIGDVKISKSPFDLGGSVNDRLSVDGSHIDVVESKWSPTKFSIIEFLTDEAARGQGKGGKLLDEAISKYGDELSGAFSSKESARSAYNRGFRPTVEDYENLSLDDIQKKVASDGSVTMAFKKTPTSN